MIALDGAVSGALPLERRGLPVASSTIGELVADLASLGGGVWVRGGGSSMSPTIRHHDRVLLIPATSVAPGAIVLVESRGRAVLHRVVRVERETVWTRGDASLVTDEPVATSAIRARAVARERHGRLTALAWVPALGPAALARGLWWTVRRRLTRVVRGARALRELAA